MKLLRPTHLVIHCVSVKQAEYIKQQVAKRLELFKLELHSEKTKVVYVGKQHKRNSIGEKPIRKFTFLGYDFKPRMMKDKLVYSPGIGKGALIRMARSIRECWGLHMTQRKLYEIAMATNPIIRGWINYYGHYRRSELQRLVHMIDTKLTKFLKRKFKKMNTWDKAWKGLTLLKKKYPWLFCHWYMVRSNYHTVKEVYSKRYSKMLRAVSRLKPGAV